MAAGAVEAIGVISGLLGIVQFGMTNFADDTEPGSTIKVAVALDGPWGSTEAGGDLPDVRVWNDMGEFVGMTADPGTVDDGTVGTVTVDHDNQGVYSLFSANDDAICVAWVTNTWSDEAGSNKYAVSGDYGEVCGATWYESHMYTDSDQEYQPKCFWIDKNGDQPSTGFQVRWPAYSSNVFDENDTDPSKYCNDIDFGVRTEEDPNYINNWVPAEERDTSNHRSRVRRRPKFQKRAPWTTSELVISDSKWHSAERLCTSESSMGPDFAHTSEGVFCDMGEKILYPICGSRVEGTSTPDACFDVDSQTLRENNAKQGADGETPSSKYTSLRDWRSSANGKA